MSIAAEHPIPSVVQQDWPPCYEIIIRTWLTDASAAADLTAKVSEGLASVVCSGLF